MLTAALLSMSMIQAPPPGTSAMMVELLRKGEERADLSLRIQFDKMEKPQTCPLHKWQFEYVNAGYGRTSPGDPLGLRFRVFSQYRKSENDPADGAVRMLMRLWDWNIRRLNLGEQLVTGGFCDLYLAFGGKAGGEQLMTSEERNGRTAAVNVMYIYDVTSFTDPLEMAREIAHEYGHASLPAVGGYKVPEEWANGELGERIYLTWALEAIQDGQLRDADFMGASLKSVQNYVDTKVRPLADAVLENGPNWPKLDKDMNAYLGVALAAQRLLPVEQFARAFALNETKSATGFGKSVAAAASEAPWSFGSKEWVGKSIWVPTGLARITGMVVAKKSQGWSFGKVTQSKVTVTPAAR
ncbi:MAG: hypothetical protein JST40_11195 [Armatimonadetes bacterium]|nr:hypothetical protein [Armatimonadota bacterium]